MGFLAMIGLVTAEEHAKVVTKVNEDQAKARDHDKALQHVAEEQFSGVVGLPNKVALAVQRLKESKDIQFKNRQRYLTAETGLAEAKAAYDNEHSDLKSAIETIKGLRAQLEAAQQVIEQHKTDVAELATFRAARDRDNELRRQRRVKVKPAEPAKPVAKAKPAKKAVRK